MEKVWVVVETDGENDFPVVFSNAQNAYDYILTIITDHKEQYDYDEEEFAEALKDLTESYNKVKTIDYNLFGCYLGELHIYSYNVEIN